MDREQFEKHVAWVARFPERATERASVYKGFWTQFLGSEPFNYSATKIVDGRLLFDTLARVREDFDQPPAPPALPAPPIQSAIIEGVEPMAFRFTPSAEASAQIEANFAELDAWIVQLEEYVAAQQELLAAMPEEN